MPAIIATLAPELLIQIFNDACAIDYSFLQLDYDPSLPLPPPTADHIDDLLALSQVCAQWRSILTIGMPELWSIFCIRRSDNYRKRQSWLPWLQLCLERSASSPLYIDIRAAHEGFRGHHLPPPAAEVMSLFLPHHPRWRIFQFVGCCGYCADLYCKSAWFRPIQRFDRLEVAYIDLSDGPVNDLHFHGAVLRSPRIRRYRQWSDPEGRRIPPAGIEYLGLGCLSLADAARAFECAKELRSVQFTLDYISPPFPDTRYTVALTRLHTLRVSIFNETNRLFDLLTLPSLRHLHISYDLEPNPLPVYAFGHLGRLLARSQCKIESLAIIADRTSAGDRAELLEILRDSQALQGVQDLHAPISHDEFLHLPPCMPRIRCLRVSQTVSRRKDLLHAVAAFGVSRISGRGSEHIDLPQPDDMLDQSTLDYFCTLNARLFLHNLLLVYNPPFVGVSFDPD
ncbi:hypothetical protein HGRIS_011882 [Hohenbuehelia grisea]|uniref:F-box domain-containing protein n=1 Tax=Hohenbuehelia grisea TaxID=104357 RepID=A0ABR3JYH9_9AGAR